MKISILLLFCIVAILSEEVEFNRQLVSVLFDICIFPGDVDVGDPYGENDIMKMITTISSKFDKVLMQPLNAVGYNPENSRALIPSVAARFNKKRMKYQRRVEITMSYTPQLQENIHTNFDLQKKLADQANSIHRGTISSLVMYFYDGLNKANIQNITDSLQYGRSKISSDSNNDYNLGAWLPYEDCKKSDLLQRISNYTDFILIQSESILHELTIEIHSQQIIKGLENCQKKISKSNFKNKTEIRFFTHRSSVGKLGLNDFVKFWVLMNKWAKKTNTQVVFLEAFDNFRRRPAKYNYCGWWRALDNVNGTLFDFKLEEKATVLKHGSKINSPKFKNFSKTNFMVVFEPWVTPYDYSVKNAYDQSVLQNMLNTISTRFGKVLLREYAFSSIHFNEGRSELPIMNTTALLNREKITKGSLPMEVTITCKLELPINTKEPTSFDIAKRLADEANTIYPGTVKTIFIKYWDLDSKKGVQTAKSQLLYAKQKIMNESESPFHYKLGMFLRIYDCGRSRLHLRKWLIPVLPHMDAVLFDDSVTNSEWTAGVASTFSLKFKGFERCLQKIQSHTNTTSIGFQTRWPDTNITGAENMTALVDFWKRANQWAVALNTKIVMLGAFDPSSRVNEHEKTTGWWKLDGRSNYRNPAEYVFVEKEWLLEKKLNLSNPSNADSSSKSTKPQSDEGLSTLKAVIIVGIAVLVVLIFISCAAFLIYKRVMRKVEVKCLTLEETRQFFQGGPGGTTSTSSSIEHAPYNQELEISKDDFTIEESGLLGMGTFGAVFRAVIRTTNGDRQAAVKMTMISSPSSAVKSLLSEIKILSHVGLHENIVGLVGAHTTDISQGGVLVFLELCPNGSLEKYLRDYNRQYELRNNKTLAGSSNDSPYLDTIELAEVGETEITPQLRKWSYEIACGMEFLAKKHVVHGDLAARNVLLTENKTAKISDFGLSRRMYDYTNYFKSQQEPLPWRWMAPESLKRMEFGEKSDIWAFGVTLWEIYSFGDVPYPGLPWSTDFVKRLEQGLQPDQPRHASQEMYNNILIKCWELFPSLRPTFAEIKDMLKLNDDN